MTLPRRHLRARQGTTGTPGTPTPTPPAVDPPATPPTTSSSTTSTTSSAQSTSSASSSSASSSASLPSTSSSISTSSSSIPSTTSAPSTTTQPTSSDTSTTPPPTSSTSSNISATHISRVVSTNADGGIVTITTLVDAPPASSSVSNNNSGDGVGFLQNKAAMGATFAVAGIAALVLAFLFITTCIRRSRAMKFDRDVAAAAAVAAAESQAIRPFDDDDDDDVFTSAPRARGGGYGYAPGKMAEHDPYAYAAAGVVGSGPGAFGAPPQPMRQQQTGGPLAYPTAQQYPVQLFDQPHPGGVFGRQVGHQEVYTLQDLGTPADIPRRPGSASTGHGSLPGIAGVGTQGSVSGAGAGAGRSNGMAALVGAAGLASSAGAATAHRHQHDDPYGGYVTSPVGESRYPQPRWSQQPGLLPTPPEQQQAGWYQQYGQPPTQQQWQQQQRPPSPTATPAPAYSPPPGGLTAQGYPNEKSTYSHSRSVTSAQTVSNEGPSTSGGHTAVSTNPPGTPPDEDDVGSILEGTEGPRVLKVTNE